MCQMVLQATHLGRMTRTGETILMSNRMIIAIVYIYIYVYIDVT